jgi:spore germination protein
MKKLFAICLLLLSAGSVAHAASPFEKLFYFYDSPEARASLKANVDKMEVFAPQEYSINKMLVPYGSLNQDIKNIIAGHPVKVMPLITNDGFRQDIVHNLLISNPAQDVVINFMVSEALKNNYIGWQFDLERILFSDRDAYSNFVKKTYEVFKKNNLLLSIATVVKTDNATSTTDRYRDWEGAFDYPTLAKYVDFMTIMTYDDPDSVGPPASLPFVEKSLNYILSQNVPPEKISLGIASYYWSWMVNPPKKLRYGSYDRLVKIKSRTKYTEGFDMNLGMPWVAFKESGVDYIVWQDNLRSYLLKQALVNKNKLRGISMWVLGTENPEIWKGF